MHFHTCMEIHAVAMLMRSSPDGMKVVSMKFVEIIWLIVKANKI